MMLQEHPSIPAGENSTTNMYIQNIPRIVLLSTLQASIRLTICSMYKQMNESFDEIYKSFKN